MKKVLLAGMLLSSLVYNVGCDTADYNSATYGVGVGIGLGPWGDGYYDPIRDGRDGFFGGGFYGPHVYRPNPMGHRPGDVHVNPDGLGGHHDGGHMGGGHMGDHGGFDGGHMGGGHMGDHGGFGGGHMGGGHGGHRMLEVSSLDAPADNVNFDAMAQDYKVTSFANKHQIPVAAAAKIETAFENVNESGSAAFASVGLNDGAIQNIMNMSLPAQDSVNSVAKALEITPAQSQALLQNLVNEFRAEAANGNSKYWKTCQATGHWKTPQNANCSDASWNGCSPETGATVCY